MSHWILDTQGKTAHKIRERNCVRTGESMQLETSVLLSWFQWAEGRICVWNVMSGDTRGDSVFCVLPDVHSLLTIMDGDEVCACMWVESGREKIYECEFISAPFTLVCLQGQPDTCQCNEASGVWVYAGVVLGGCDWTLVVGNMVRLHVCVCVCVCEIEELYWACNFSLA